MQNKTDKRTSLVSKSLSVTNSSSISRLFSARNKKCHVPLMSAKVLLDSVDIGYLL